jgi:hypothetical protein
VVGKGARAVLPVTRQPDHGSQLNGKRRLFPWFQTSALVRNRLPDSDTGVIPSFDIAPDGKRFAFLTSAEGADEQKPPTQMIFLFNFFDELRRRVPVR